VYLDTPYIVKFYFNEPESPRVRELVRTADTIHSSVWALAEFHGVIHRRLREGSLSPLDARALSSRFYEHVQEACGSSYQFRKLCCGEPAPWSFPHRPASSYARPMRCI